MLADRVRPDDSGQRGTKGSEGNGDLEGVRGIGEMAVLSVADSVCDCATVGNSKGRGNELGTRRASIMGTRKKGNGCLIDGANAYLNVSTPSHPDLWCIIDAADIPLLKPLGKWTALKSQDGHRFYVYGRIGKRTIKLHRLLLGILDRRIGVDHKDGDGLNNRRSNLRIADAVQNGANRRKNITSSSNYKGVEKSRLRWRARIFHHKKVVNVGHFKTEIEAAKAYDRKARELFGEFARTNFQ